MSSFLKQESYASRVQEDASSNHDCSSDADYIEIKHYSNGKPVSVETVSLTPSTSLGGKAETNMSPGGLGRVFHQGISWKAVCCGSQKILKDERVLVLQRQGLTLLVVAADPTFSKFSNSSSTRN